MDKNLTKKLREALSTQTVSWYSANMKISTLCVTESFFLAVIDLNVLMLTGRVFTILVQRNHLHCY